MRDRFPWHTMSGHRIRYVLNLTLPTKNLSVSVHAQNAVTRLNLTEYRNIRHLRLESEARVVVLSGPNGAGKTNILESISFLSPGRGLRRARLTEVVRRGGAESWAVAAHIRDPRGMTEIGTGLVPGEQGVERRLVKIDGRTVRGTAPLTQAVTLNWLTPQMDRLFIEGPGARRRFLDRLVYGFDAEHASRGFSVRPCVAGALSSCCGTIEVIRRGLQRWKMRWPLMASLLLQHVGKLSRG